jgi:hypothetical protein
MANKEEHGDTQTLGDYDHRDEGSDKESGEGRD